ncbi:MAG: hypothetical protein JRJ65_13475, partial [Deltaproteobacteria bacterium]|nr:hypothetical protein [Deltaproteobacteria bacterium]
MMDKKDKRPIYEPHRSRDLSAFSASGDVGWGCRDGGDPLQECAAGLNHHPSNCTPGATPGDPVCKNGSVALVH